MSDFKLGAGVTTQVASSRMVKLLNKIVSDGETTLLLRKNGFVKFDKKIKFDGITHNVWYRGIAKSRVHKTFLRSLVRN